MSHTTLTLAPGSGLVCRRGGAIMFVPEPDDRAKLLLDAFAHGSVDQTWSRVAQTLVDHDLDICAFAFIEAGRQLDLRVFGSVEIRTDLTSVPMLSGAGSLTWIEHRVRADQRTPVQLRVGSNEIDERTQLTDGQVHAAGLVATVTMGTADFIDTTGARPGVITARDDQPTSNDSSPSVLLSYLLDEKPELALDAPEPVANGSTIDLSDGLDVPARLCPDGHANAPARANCLICDRSLPLGDTGLTSVARPSLGTLVFDDGTEIELDTDVVIGRDPHRSGDGWVAKAIEGDRVSRTHLTVRCSDWQVMVEDCGSRNGTVVVPDHGAQPVALIAGTPHQIDPGARLYFGSASAEFRARTA